MVAIVKFFVALLRDVSFKQISTSKGQTSRIIYRRTHECATPPGTIYINCHSSVTYLISCDADSRVLQKQSKN